MSVFDTFEKKHDYLVCVDSDGCAMDTMNCKHIHCFGPCMVNEWALEQWEAPVLRRWNEINLFQMTRGINRFKGLAIALREIDSKYTPIIGVQTLAKWAETAPALSNDGLAVAIAAAQEADDHDGAVCLRKALQWSVAVNEAITMLPEELKKPFPGAREGLTAAAQFADIAVVSSANRDAVEEEWEKYGLLAHTDILLAQDCGSKAHCIRKMLEYGYATDHVLMVGDAPGDCAAAQENGVWFYPILVTWEEESWNALISEALPLLLSGRYGTCQAEKQQVFVDNLGG